jgi:hypothetical protein
MNTLITPQEAARGMMDSIRRVAAEENIPESAVAVLAAGILGAEIDPDTLQWAADEIAKAKRFPDTSDDSSSKLLDSRKTQQ